MFDNRARTLYEKGLFFSEEDIIYDDHIFSGNQEIKVTLDYLQNGFGVLFCLKSGAPLASQTYYYLLKIGYQEASLFLVDELYHERIGQYPFTFNAPCLDMEFCARLEDDVISLIVNNTFLGKTKLPVPFTDYSLGYYSQRGNTIKTIALSTETPYAWDLSIDSMQGSRISFDKNTVFLEGTNAAIEFLQTLELEEGRYYLKYDSYGDITPVVYLTRTAQIFDDHKNLLKDNSFELLSDDRIILKFKGTSGAVKNIQITDEPDNAYVATSHTTGVQSSSSITLTTKQLKRLDCIFQFNKKIEKAYLFKDEYTSYAMPELLPGTYTLLIKDQKVSLLQGSKIVFEKYFTGYTLTLFINTDSVIKEFMITSIDYQKFDWLKQQEYTEYIENLIDTPILVTDTDNKVYDLSSSFRVVDDNYVFTNIEREYFKPITCCKLYYPIKSIAGVYGIPKGIILNKDTLYNGTRENIHDLTAYASYYDELNYFEDYTFDEHYNQLILNKASDYQEIIIDYLKAESYSINFIHEIYAYEVKMTENNYRIYYENKDKSYYATTLKPTAADYIVLKKDGVL